jgi:hypothetical protein
VSEHQKPDHEVQQEIATFYPTTSAVDPVADVFRKLDALLKLENSNGYEFRASEHAHRNARSYLEGIRFLMETNYLLNPDLVPDGEGGIDIEWEFGDKQITLSCRARENQQDFIYWQQGDHYQAADASPTLLRDRLNWLIHE